MIGIGTWKAKINTMFFKAEATVDILDNNGEYDFRFYMPERFSNVKIRYFDIHEDGNTLYGKGEANLLPGKIFEAQVTFNGDRMTGKITLPFLGGKSVTIQDGHRIQ